MAKGLKTGGRKKGTTNKITNTVKEMIKDFITNELNQLPDIVTKMEAKERVDIVIKLLPYIIPKLNPTEISKEDIHKRSWDIVKQSMNTGVINSIK